VVLVVDLGGVLGNDDVDDEDDDAADTEEEDLDIDDDEEEEAAVVVPLALATRARDVPLPPALPPDGLLCFSFSFCSLYSRSFRSAGVSTL
jgi:hypothetical protein